MSAFSFYYVDCCKLSNFLLTNMESCDSLDEIYNIFHNKTQDNKLSFNCLPTLKLDKSKPIRHFAGSIVAMNSTRIDDCYYSIYIYDFLEGGRGV